MKSLLMAFVLFTTGLAHAGLTQEGVSDPMQVMLTQADAKVIKSTLTELLGSHSQQVSVDNLECREGIDWNKGEVNCVTFDMNGPKNISGNLATQALQVIEAAQNIVYSNKTNRLVRGVDIIKPGRVECNAKVCVIEFTF